MTLKRRLAAIAVGAGLAPMALVILPAGTASAHGYVSTPPSRQANCASGKVANCGEIIYEPQSVEGVKGLRSCSGGNSRFATLDEESRRWPATQVGGTVTFNWVLTARHATSTWEYFIGGTKIATVDDGGRQPNAMVRHSVNLGGRTGRQKILAVWNIADTVNAFYSCIDVEINSGAGTPPTTASPAPSSPATTSTARPSTATPPATSPKPPVTPTKPPVTSTKPPTGSSSPSSSTAPAGGAWAPDTRYSVGSIVTHAGATYRCRQAHTTLTGWEPPVTPALWLRL